jgi:hypothetical protein
MDERRSMTAKTRKEPKHLQESAKIVHTLWKHGRDINTDGTSRKRLHGAEYFEAEGNNWNEIVRMVERWMREEL